MSINNKLLLIEDDIANQASSFTYFLNQQHGPYAITSTSSLREAENHLLAESFDLILLDHGLCSDHSLNFSAFFQQIPVILITEDNDEQGVKMMLQGVDDILSRDEEGKYCSDLFVTIEKSLARRQMRFQHNLNSQSHLAGKSDHLQRLTACLAHDLSNVLSPILGFSTILLDETEKNAAHLDLVQEIHRSAVRAKNMVRQLSIFSEKEATGKYTQINLTDVLNNLKNALQSTLSDNVTLDINIETTVPPILGDIAIIEQTVMSLCLYLQDAIDHTGKMSLSICQVRNIDESTPSKAATYVLLKAEAATIDGKDEQFNSPVFHQCKHHYIELNEKNTVDTGLAFIRTIIKQHDGFVHVDSNKNTLGVELSFPASGEPLPSNALQTTDDQTRQECCELILLVESDVSVIKLITPVLQQKGYTVHAADNEKDAYEFASRGKERVDLLLADTAIIEPQNNRVYTTLVENNKAVKVFYMATTNNQHTPLDLKKINTEQLIYKPFALSQLTERVRQTLDHKS